MFAAISLMLRKKGLKVFFLERNSQNVQGLWWKMHAFKEGIYSSSAKKELSYILTIEHPDVVHVHNVYPLISPSVLVACRKSDMPVVMTCHNYRLICPTGVFFDEGEICERCNGGREYWCVLKNCRENIFESIGYALRTAVARKFLLFKDYVTLFIALTEFAKNRLIKAGFPEECIVVVPNMVSIPDSAIDPSGGRYVAFVGRMSSEKGVDTLLEAAARVPEVGVRLAGDGPIKPQLAEKAPRNATFMGWLHKAQLASLYRKARFVVVPSICFETFGLTAAEAMSHGLPVIASRTGGLPEIVEDVVTGFLFEPGNAEELADKMKLLWESPNLCQEMGQAGREKAIREYSEDVYYERLMAVYKKAIEINKERKQHKTKPL